MATIVDELQSIGHAVPKPDAFLKATGSATYAGDVRLPGMLQAKVLRSPYPHARIVSIDTSAADALPGVYAIVTGADCSPVRIGRFLQDRYALAREKVIYVGEPVAAVAAVDEETADRAIQLIDVVYDPLAAVLDPEHALDPDQPIIHPDLASYTDMTPSERTGNQRNHVDVSSGDVDAAWSEPGLVTVEATYRTPRQSQAFTEPHAAVAQPDGRGKITIWASTKAPFRSRGSIADTLGVPASRVRLISPVIGGDFGGKGAAFIEPIVALLARKAQKPVRLTLSRVEELTAMTSRPSCVINLKVGARPDGTLVAMEGHMLYNVGAVDDNGGGVGRSADSLAGGYRIPHKRLVATSVYTNTSPGGHVRAPSGPQTSFATESLLDTLARKLNMDPIELRLKNALHNGETVPSGHGILANSGLQECIERARDWMARELGPKGPNEGVGVALALWALHPAALAVASAATVKIDAEGGVVLSCGVTDQGGGQWTMAAQVVSEVLGVPMGQISVIMSDTEATPPDTGTGGSGTTYRVGNIVGFAAEDARRQVVRIAAERLKVDEEELVLRDGEVCVRSDPSKKLTLARVASAAGSSPGGAIIGTSQDVREEYLSAHAHELAEYVDAPSFAAHVAKVRVDPETGQIDVLKYYTAQDVGKALNLLNCTGQIEGGVVFGLGYALSEEIITEDGTNLNANLWEYLLPTAPHIPPITVDLVEIPSTYGPYGAKGVGETPCVGVAPAIANAVEDAIGARVTQAPLTPERVLAALRAKQAGV